MFFEESRAKYLNILILGETGVGKSTFINGLANYLKYETINEALEEKIQILIQSTFTVHDEHFQTRNIILQPNITGADEGAKNNEHLLFGQSATQDPKSYLFTYHDGSRKIRIIDTPGIGDTRGIEQDKKNFEKILSFISGFSELHAICILIKPNSSRLTLSFRFCIDELLVHLHKSAARNILFCFTNTRGTLYKPGDTLPTLREHLKKLEDKRGIIIPSDGSTLFSFDNESFRFLCAKKEGFPFSPSEEDSFESSWTKSVEETQRLFDRISQLPVHRIYDTLSLNNTRNVILSLTRPLAEIARVQMINKANINEKTEETERLMASMEELQNKLIVEKQKVIRIDLSTIQTVCINKECIKKSNNVYSMHKAICHSNCNCVSNVQLDVCPISSLQRCEILRDSIMSCLHCGCPWNTHIYTKHRMDQTKENIEDIEIRGLINKKKETMDFINNIIAETKQKNNSLIECEKRINRRLSSFVRIIREESIIPYNEALEEYLDFLIREEKQLTDERENTEILDKLFQNKKEYLEEINIIEKTVDSHDMDENAQDVVFDDLSDNTYLPHLTFNTSTIQYSQHDSEEYINDIIVSLTTSKTINRKKTMRSLFRCPSNFPPKPYFVRIFEYFEKLAIRLFNYY